MELEEVGTKFRPLFFCKLLFKTNLSFFNIFRKLPWIHQFQLL